MAITALIGTKTGVDVHKAGCRDLGKRNNKFVAGIETYENVAEMFEELLDTGDPNEPGWIEAEFKFFPCANRPDTPNKLTSRELAALHDFEYRRGLSV